jgi:hypothetical protein
MTEHKNKINRKSTSSIASPPKTQSSRIHRLYKEGQFKEEKFEKIRNL